MRALLRRAGAVLALAALAASVGCARARRTPPATDSVAFDRPHETTIGRAALAETADHEGETGVHLLASGLDAFAARVVLIDAAEEAIDVQYYIFRGDDSGLSLLVRLLAAADRGVRVRLLLDDVGAGALDETLAALATHPGIDVRLFNPIERGLFTRVRSWLDLAARAFELNHRMHNKMLAVDGAAAIVGGRNVGDEYFDAGSGANFADLDLLAVGAVLGELGESFDRYWSSTYAVPVDSWRSVRAEPGDLEAVRAELDEHERLQADSSYLQRVRSTELVEDLRRGSLPLIWADAHAVSDHPSKIEAGPDELEETLLTSQLAEHFAEPQRDVLVVSPYFVPGDAGVQRLCDAAGRGVRVRVLTNSLAATDVAAVHAGYAPYREPLLECGVDLYELKHTGELHRQAERAGVFGSASASLHAKTFLVDESRVFVGSLNVDPRSIVLNTELGLVVESVELGEQLVDRVEIVLEPELSWRLELEDGEIVWLGSDGGVAERVAEEPGTSWWLRSRVWMLGLLPIEGQL